MWYQLPSFSFSQTIWMSFSFYSTAPVASNPVPVGPCTAPAATSIGSGLATCKSYRSLWTSTAHSRHDKASYSRHSPWSRRSLLPFTHNLSDMTIINILFWSAVSVTLLSYIHWCMIFWGSFLVLDRLAIRTIHQLAQQLTQYSRQHTDMATGREEDLGPHTTIGLLEHDMENITLYPVQALEYCRLN